MSRWKVGPERLVDENRHIRLSTVDVVLPDGTEFTQYVIRMPACAVTVVLDDDLRVLLMRRHRFILDRWVWELPGGYVLDDTEDLAAEAAREVEEETGWRPRSMEHLVTFQPSTGSIDQPQVLFLARGADKTDTVPDVNETDEIRWVPLDEAVKMVERGELVGAASVVGVYRVLSLVS